MNDITKTMTKRQLFELGNPSWSQGLSERRTRKRKELYDLTKQEPENITIFWDNFEAFLVMKHEELDILIAVSWNYFD